MSFTFGMQEEELSITAPLQFDYREVLLGEFRSRQSRNPRYSLRSFSRDLKVSLTSLSDVFAGKRNFSKKNAMAISKNLNWSPLMRHEFLESIDRVKKGKVPVPQSLVLSDDRFQFVSEWPYLAVLALAEIKEQQATSQWLAKRLGISDRKAEEILERLIRLGYLRIERSKMVRTIPQIETDCTSPSELRKHFHRQMFMVAEHAMDHVNRDLREFCSSTLAVDVRKLPEAKRLMAQFQKKMEKLLGSAEKNSVYSFSMQLFPTTMIDGEQV